MSKLYKYPRTYHFLWSPGTTSDDRFLRSIDQFLGKEIVATEKMDGENTTMYPDHIHARSLDSNHHPSRTAIKQLHGQIKHNIPEGFRICGENMYAKHSIFYDKLPSYFLVFSIWNGDICLSWDETKEYCALLGLMTVPELYRGVWNEDIIKTLFTGASTYGPEQEGYVVRTTESFLFNDFINHVGKFVRAKHVRTSTLWMNEPVIPNKLQTN
jgi:hypothetical protein